MSLLLLVVSDNDEFDPTKVDVDGIDGILLVVCKSEGYVRLKHRIQDFCINNFLWFEMSFVIPPLSDSPSRELLIGHGKGYDGMVKVYGDSETNECGDEEKVFIEESC